MTQLTKRSLLLLALTLPLNTVHQYFEPGSTVNNWLNGMDYDLDITWYVRELGVQLTMLIHAWIIYDVSRINKYFRMGALVYLVLSVFSVIMFFVCFNRINYSFYFSMIGALSVIVLYVKDKKVRRKRGRDVDVIGRAKRDYDKHFGDTEFAAKADPFLSKYQPINKYL